jgi:hypothetical protein
MKKTANIVTMLFVGYSLAVSAEPQNAKAAINPSPATAAAARPDTVATAKTAANQNTSTPPSAVVRFSRLSLRSRPDSASIVIDSLDKGQTPAVIDSLVAGQHTILVKKKGYFVKKVTTTLSPDSLHEITVVLVKPGCMVVKTDPPGAKVLIDNKETGTTPFEYTKFKPGAYTLRLELPQRETIERPVTLAEGESDTISISLPFSKAYRDSVERVQKAAKEKKSKFKKTVDLIAIGAFVVFGAVILLFELGNAD